MAETAIDPALTALTSANLLTGVAAGHLRRETFADESGASIIAGMNILMEKARQQFSNLSDLIMVRCAETLTGQDSSVGQGILLQRSVQGQPGQQTVIDPNWRAAALAPLPSK